MTRKHPKLNITLSPAAHEALGALAEQRGTSKSGVLQDLILRETERLQRRLAAQVRGENPAARAEK